MVLLSWLKSGDCSSCVRHCETEKGESREDRKRPESQRVAERFISKQAACVAWWFLLEHFVGLLLQQTSNPMPTPVIHEHLILLRTSSQILPAYFSFALLCLLINSWCACWDSSVITGWLCSCADMSVWRISEDPLLCSRTNPHTSFAPGDLPLLTLPVS